MANHDVTVIDLTYLLIAAESAMIWSTGQANFSRRSISQTSMDIDNGHIGSPEKLSLPNGKGSAKFELFDQMVKRKFEYEIVPCTIRKSLFVSIAKRMGIRCEAAVIT
ncbi:hypothetical protein Lser_V15G45422 [Lactuca serriola]